jgi:deazaflavin-dependent oxidoreductase (nitroreductase family)
MNGNDFVTIMLRSPLYVFMGNTMLITVTGRKTRRQITVPVNYYRALDELWVITTRSRKWWRNVKGGADVDLHLRGKDLKGFAEVVLDESAVAARIVDYVRYLPISAGALGIRVENGVPNGDDAARIAKERLFVKICLRP